MESNGTVLQTTPGKGEGKYVVLAPNAAPGRAIIERVGLWVPTL